MSDAITIPESVAQRLSQKFQAARRAQRELQEAVDIVAETAGVPDGYEYRESEGAFVPKPTES